MEEAMMFYKQEKELEKIFYEFFKSKEYYVHLYGDDEVDHMGHGGYAVKDDKFSVFFGLSGYLYPREFYVTAYDRNGNYILIGEDTAIYELSKVEDMPLDELKSKFKILLSDIYEKYKEYSKDNRLDFVFNNLKTDRKDYTNINLKNEEEINYEAKD